MSAKSLASTKINDQNLVEKFHDNLSSCIEKSDNFKKGPTTDSWPKRYSSSNGGSSELTNYKDTFYRNVRDQKEYEMEKIDGYSGEGNRRPSIKNERR